MQAVPWKLKLKFLWSWAFKCNVKTYTTRLSTKCYFITIILLDLSANSGIDHERGLHSPNPEGLAQQLKVDYNILGQFFNTMAKGCNHELCGPLKLIQRRYHGKLILKFVWSWAFSCSVRHTRPGSQPNGTSLPSYSCGPFYKTSFK